MSTDQNLKLEPQFLNFEIYKLKQESGFGIIVKNRACFTLTTDAF